MLKGTEITVSEEGLATAAQRPMHHKSNESSGVPGCLRVKYCAGSVPGSQSAFPRRQNRLLLRPPPGGLWLGLLSGEACKDLSRSWPVKVEGSQSGLRLHCASGTGCLSHCLTTLAMCLFCLRAYFTLSRWLLTTYICEYIYIYSNGEEGKGKRQYCECQLS